jgi:uncharacterized protein
VIRVRVHDTLAAVPAAAWAPVAAEAGLYSSHEWLTHVERETPGLCRYLLAWDGAAIAGALPVYLVADEPNQYYDPRTVFHAAMPGRNGRYCLAGSRSGYSNELLLASSLAEDARHDVVTALLDEVAVLSGAAGQEHSFFLYLNDRGLRRITACAENACPLLSYSGDAWLAARGGGFEDYLAGLSATRRKTTRKEIRCFAEHGLTVTRADPRDRLDLIVEFARRGNEKYGIEDSAAELRTRFGRQCATLGAHGVLFVCHRGSTVAGVALAYRWRDWLYLRMSGFDHATASSAYLYFNVVIYEPLRYCYETGLRGLHLGTGSHHAKAARGARIGPLASVALPLPGAARADPATPAARAGVRRYWEQQFASTPRLFDEELWRPWLGGR